MTHGKSKGNCSSDKSKYKSCGTSKSSETAILDQADLVNGRLGLINDGALFAADVSGNFGLGFGLGYNDPALINNGFDRNGDSNGTDGDCDNKRSKSSRSSTSKCTSKTDTYSCSTKNSKKNDCDDSSSSSSSSSSTSCESKIKSLKHKLHKEKRHEKKEHKEAKQLKKQLEHAVEQEILLNEEVKIEMKHAKLVEAALAKELKKEERLKHELALAKEAQYLAELKLKQDEDAKRLLELKIVQDAQIIRELEKMLVEKNRCKQPIVDKCPQQIANRCEQLVEQNKCEQFVEQNECDNAMYIDAQSTNGHSLNAQILNENEDEAVWAVDDDVEIASSYGTASTGTKCSAKTGHKKNYNYVHLKKEIQCGKDKCKKGNDKIKYKINSNLFKHK